MEWPADDGMETMDLKNPQVQKWLLTAMIVGVGTYFWYTGIYTDNQQKTDAGYMRLEGLRTELKEVELKFRSLESLKAEYYDLTRRYRLVSQLLPEDDQLSPLLSKIHAAALETSSLIASVSPLPVVSSGFYDRENFNLKLHTTYHDLGDFLSRISNMPFIVNIETLSMMAVDETATPEVEGGGFTVTAEMQITTFHVKESERLVLMDDPEWNIRHEVLGI